MSSTEKVGVVVEDPPKLESWSVVGRQLYTSTERTRLVGGNPREPAVSIYLIFLNKLITGELFQTPQDWQDLQRRLRAHGYSDDLTGLKQTMLVPGQPYHRHGDETRTGGTEQTTTTAMGIEALARAAGASLAGQKRNLMDCHGANENGIPQDNPNHKVDDYETWRKKLKLTLHDRLRASADRFVHDTTYTPKRRMLRNLHLALHRNDAHQNLSSLENPSPLHQNDAPAGAAVVIPQDPGEAHTMAERMAAAPDDGWRLCRDRRQLASAVQAALREYQGHFHDSSWGNAPATTRKDVPLAVHNNNREETVPATFDKTVPLPLADTRKSVPAASRPIESFHPLSLSMDLTKPGSGVISSDVDKTQGMVLGDTTTTPITSATMNNHTQDFDNEDKQVALVTPEKSETTDKDSTSSPTEEPKEVPVLFHPIMDVADTATAVPTESKETPPVTEDTSLNRQEQKEEEGEVAESSSMIISADANTTSTTTTVVVPDHSNPHYGGLFRNLMITLVVWSISLHVFLWTLLETTDHRLWRMMNEPYNIPLRVCLSMEAIRQPHVHSLFTVADSNPTHGPWLGGVEGEDASSARTMMSWHKSSSSIHLHRLCSPWYGVMSLTLGVLFSICILTKLLKTKKEVMMVD